MQYLFSIFISLLLISSHHCLSGKSYKGKDALNKNIGSSTTQMRGTHWHDQTNNTSYRNALLSQAPKSRNAKPLNPYDSLHAFQTPKTQTLDEYRASQGNPIRRFSNEATKAAEEPKDRKQRKKKEKQLSSGVNALSACLGNKESHDITRKRLEERQKARALKKVIQAPSNNSGNHGVSNPLDLAQCIASKATATLADLHLFEYPPKKKP